MTAGGDGTGPLTGHSTIMSTSRDIWLITNEGSGSVREELLAARRGGIPKVLIPQENVKDLAEIPDRITDGVEIVPVAHVDEVLAHALVRKPEAIEWTEADDLASQPISEPPFAESGQTTH